jgi:uncharacterized cupin superfamily protein
MSKVKIDKLSEQEIAQRGIRGWPIWEKEVSEFPWTYDSIEECLILEGEVTVTPEGAAPVTVGAGDFVTFPNGMNCTWKVTKRIRKHYNFR